MSLNKFTNTITGLDLKLNIGCDNLECNILKINDSIILPPSLIIDNLTVNKLLVNEELKVVNDDLTFTNYTAPSNGDLGDILSTDGNGKVYWSSNPGPPGIGIIYNGTLPATVNTILKSSNITGTTCNESCLNESSTELNSTKDIYINSIKVATVNNNPFNQTLNTFDPVIFQTVSSYLDYGSLQFNQLNPKVSNDLNIGTQNTSVLNLGGNGVNLENGNLSLLNKISTDSIYPKTFTTSSIDLSVDENIKVNTSNFLLNGIQIATIDDLPGPQTLQSVYDYSSNPAEVILVDNKPIIFKDTSDNVALFISSDGITTQAGGVIGSFYNSKMNTIQRAYNGDTKIEVIEDIPLTTVRTTFTEDQEFVSKLYVDSQVVGIPSLTQVIDSSGVPVLCQITYGNFIEFRTDDTDNILTINATAGNNYGISAEYATLDYLTSTTSTSGSFIKNNGTNQQYLMADGSSLQFSQNSGNSNFYLFDNSNNITIPPPSNGHIGYNNSIQASATIIYISHLTSDGIDIDVFFTQLTSIQDVYIQDKNSSVNFIKYNITGTPTIISNSYISIPVLYTAPNAGGTGLTSFGNNTPLIVSFFTNFIEVDTRLTSLETKTQYIDIVAPNIMGITSNVLAVKSLYSYVDSTPLSIGFNSSSVDILAQFLNIKDIRPVTDNLYDIGFVTNSFKSGYFATSLRCPIYDTATSIPVSLGEQNASAVNIGRNTITTKILGTTNINNVYTLPNTAPALNQVITCSSLGVSTWITPSLGAFSFVYPYPTAIRTVITGAGTRTLCNTYTMTSNITFSSASLFFPVTGSDNTRVGIYRGDLTTGVLVGQTVSGAPSSAYFTRTITVIAGQSLTFTVGQQVVIAFTQNGSTTSISTSAGISNISLAFISGIGYATPGFPALISGIASPTVTTIRKNIDLY